MPPPRAFGESFQHPRDRFQSLWLSVLDELKFSAFDLGWVESWFDYLTKRPGDLPYRPGIDNVLPLALPAKAKVVVTGDLGTGMPAADATMRAMAAYLPDLFVHLGDVYYSGTSWEHQVRFRTPVKEAFGLLAVPVLTLCGNHDVYSGGTGYYETVDALNQKASYFCVRNEHWQFLGLDTGKSDFDPFGLTGVSPHLEDAEAKWARDKIDEHDGKTVLMTHHQPFSAYQKVGGGDTNVKLIDQLGNALSYVECWLHAHEHKLALYGPFCGVKRGRCLGAGAIPDLLAVDPYRVVNPNVPVIPVKVGDDGVVHNRSYALLELDGPDCKASYMEVLPGGGSNLVYQENL
jgi:hypothetical protein